LTWVNRSLSSLLIMVYSSFQAWFSCEARLEDCTAEARRARSKEFLIKEFSELRELCASFENTV